VEYYPAFLNLKEKQAVVVGGGPIAERKVLMLLRAGAAVTVISPLLTDRLRKEKLKKNIRHIARSYRQGDLAGSFLVIAATDKPSVNSQVALDGPSLVNVVDMPEQCTFIAPSIIQRGLLTIAISTGGASPAFSKSIRKELEKTYGAETGAYLRFVRTMRRKALACIHDKKRREQFLRGLVSEEALQRLRSQGIKLVRQAAQERFLKISANALR
jgi:precorrin-2 dehydrogenase/sirohydrochlorin ferrochelatase